MSERFRVLLVDDSVTQQLRVKTMLEAHGFEVDVTSDGAAALERLREARPPDVVLSDILMPRLDGFELCRAIRADRELRSLPVVLTSATFEHQTDRGLSLSAGADAFVSQRLSDDLVVALLREVVERPRPPSGPALDDVEFSRRHSQGLRALLLDKIDELETAAELLRDNYTATLQALVAALDVRDVATELHSQRVSAYATALATEIAPCLYDIDDLARGSLLHDIGKIGVPDEILSKPGALDDRERSIMRGHPELGHRILSGVPFLRGAAELVLAHHECWDGHGYPRGLRGEQIPLEARIFAIVDTFDALTSGRPYRCAVSVEAALEEIHRVAGTQLDPELATAAVDLGPAWWSERLGRQRSGDAQRTVGAHRG